MQSKESLSKKVTTSAVWVFSFQILDNILGLIRLVILARLLSPTDFGLVGIAWLTLQIISTFTQTGIHQALIHKQSIEKFLNTAWTYLLFRGIILYIIVFSIAPLLGSFFNNPSIIPVIRVLGLTFFIESFVNIGIVFLQKNLLFDKQFYFQLIGNLVDFTIAIVLAFILKDVWAIVYGSVANNMVRVLLSYYFSKYRPKFEFNISLFRELGNYGKWVTGSSILQFIYTQGDDILVGRIIGPTALGFYQLAYKISNLPATQITHLISNVLFPAYAQIQSDKVRLSKIYLSVLQLISYLSFFVGIIIIAFAYDFTVLFLGEKWLPIVTAMQILTLWGMVRSIGATTGPVWQALGTPSKITKVQSIQVLIMIIVIYPLTIKLGITGTALAVIIASFIPNAIAVYLMHKTLSLKIILIVRELLFPLVSSMIMYGTYMVMRANINDITFTWFFLLAIISTVIYLLSTFILYKLFGYTIYLNLGKIIDSVIANNRNNNLLLLNKYYKKIIH